MSLAINIDKVNRVLLSDGWHDVLDKSFNLDAYEYLWYPNEDTTSMDAEIVHGSGQSGVCATGFEFISTIKLEEGTIQKVRRSGPLTAIQAVETKEKSGHSPQPPEQTDDDIPAFQDDDPDGLESVISKSRLVQNVWHEMKILNNE